MCSIKFDKTGFLSLTEAGLQEIGRCDQVSQILRFICFFFEPTDSLQRWTSTRTARNRLSLRKRLMRRWIPGVGSYSRTSDRECLSSLKWIYVYGGSNAPSAFPVITKCAVSFYESYQYSAFERLYCVVLLPLLNHHHSISERWLPLALLWQSLWRSTPRRRPGYRLEIMLNVCCIMQCD